jgi:hypothetical protein
LPGLQALQTSALGVHARDAFLIRASAALIVENNTCERIGEQHADQTMFTVLVRQFSRPLFSRFLVSENAIINRSHYPKRQGVAQGVAMKSQVSAK